MADHFEKAKDEILQRTEGNGGPTNRDMLKAMGALALDVDESIDALDKKNKARHDETIKALDFQAAEIGCCQEDIVVLQRWRADSSLTCVAKVREIATEVTNELHAPTHAMHMAEHHGEPRRQDDPSDAEFTEHREPAFPHTEDNDRSFREILAGWSLLKKLAWLIVSTLIAGILLFGISYYGSLWASNRAEQSFLHIEETALPRPTVTVTVAP